jgi:AcrR family transcriptional regulator
MKLFLEEGIHTVGISRIISEADVALMTLYRQFGGKDELVAAAVEQWSARWLQWLSDKLDTCDDDPHSRFEGLWNAIEEWLGIGELPWFTRDKRGHRTPREATAPGSRGNYRSSAGYAAAT